MRAAFYPIRKGTVDNMGAGVGRPGDSGKVGGDLLIHLPGRAPGPGHWTKAPQFPLFSYAGKHVACRQRLGGPKFIFRGNFPIQMGLGRGL